MNMPAAKLIASLGDDHFHVRICNIVLHAYAAENAARMAAARSPIERELAGRANRKR
jgi:F0F1-type ATP synthase gamma subunit